MGGGVTKGFEVWGHRGFQKGFIQGLNELGKQRERERVGVVNPKGR